MSFSKPITEIIKQRFSCRSYLKQPIAAEIRVRLEDIAAEQRVGPLGGRARFELVAGTDKELKELKGLGTYGFIKGATGFIVGATTADGKHLEDFGYMLEVIILYATDLGLGTCWLASKKQMLACLLASLAKCWHTTKHVSQKRSLCVQEN